MGIMGEILISLFKKNIKFPVCHHFDKLNVIVFFTTIAFEINLPLDFHIYI